MKPWAKTIVAGVGFLSDAYDLFIIDVVKNVMSELYPQTPGDSTAVSTAALVGAVLGQVVFGALADRIGRRTIFITTLCLVLVGCFGSATAYAGGPVSVYAQLATWRFILGFGVGGEYPLSATISAESSTARTRGYAIAAVFSMQGVGKIMAAAVNAACLSSGMPLDAAWRVALAFGGIPGLLSIYHRWMLEESHAWSKMVAADKALAATSSTTPNPSVLAAAAATGKDRRISDADAGTPKGPGATAPSPIADSDIIVVGSNTMHHKSMARLMGTASSKLDSALQRLPGVQNTASVGKSLSTLWEYRWTLVGTAGNWCLLDFTFYGQGLFSGTVLAIAGITGSEGGHHSREQLQDIANGSLMLVAIAMPGYLVATALIERMGRRNMQLMGFTMDSIIYLVLGVWLTQLRGDAKGLFVLLYGLTFFFSNFGANTTTFVIPAEAFPTRARSTCHGLSAASGKLGAVLGSSGMAPLLTAYGTDAESKDRGLQLVMYICCAVSLLGVIWTMLFTVETGQRDLAALDDPTFKPALVVEAFASSLQPLAASLSKRQPAGFGYGTGTSSPVPPEDTTVHVVADAAAADAGAARDDRATRRNRTIESAASDGAGEEDRPASLLPKVVLHRIHSDIDHWHSIRAVGGDDAL